MITPIYAPVPFDLRYWASDSGSILSFAKGNRRFLIERKNKKGYPCVGIGVKRFLTHRVIVAAFDMKIEKGMQVNHIDGVKHNNSLVNLEIVTQSDNMLHAYRLGLKKQYVKEKHPRAKITQEKADMIREMYKPGVVSYKEVGNVFGVSKSLVELIIKNRIWVS